MMLVFRGSNFFIVPGIPNDESPIMNGYGMFFDSGDFKHRLNSKKSSYPVEISQLLENARPQSLMCFNDDVDLYECKKNVI